MNKQEAIERIESNALNIGDNDLVLGLSVAKHIINQINESQKVVVPQFVAEYIEYCKHEKFYALHGAYDNMDDRLKCWRFKGNNSELFAKAWLYGYEVEKEKLYEVFLKRTGAQLGVCVPHDEYKTQFTKTELQEYDFNVLYAYDVKEVEE